MPTRAADRASESSQCQHGPGRASMPWWLCAPPVRLVGKDKDRILAGLLSMLLYCANATRLQGYAGGRAPTLGALGDARAVAEGLDWTWRQELAGERVNDQNPHRSARRVRQDFGMISLESSGSDCSMGMSFRGKGVNPPYTHTRVLY